MRDYYHILWASKQKTLEADVVEMLGMGYTLVGGVFVEHYEGVIYFYQAVAKISSRSKARQPRTAKKGTKAKK